MMPAGSSFQKSSPFDAATVRDAARNRWRTILPSLQINVPPHPTRHGPCPACGGKDRFRFDDLEGTGSWFCNQCDPQAGDGFDLVQNVMHCDFPTALQLVANVLGIQPCNGKPARRIVQAYDYVDEAGTLLFQVVRYEPKDFRQRRPDGRGGWTWGLQGIAPVLYRLPNVMGATSVLIVEGERDVETAYHLGLPEGWAATTNPMGAGKWRDSYSEVLRGIHVIILPDADEPGEKHATQVAASLREKAASVRRLTLPDDSKDLSDWAVNRTRDEFHQFLNQAEEFVFMSLSRRGTLHERAFAPLAVGDFLDLGGEEEAVDWVLEDYLPAGGVVLLAGKPKEGKTTLTYELAVHVGQGGTFLDRQSQGAGVLVLAVEEHPRDVRLRLRELATDSLSNLFICARQLDPTPDTFDEIRRFVSDHTIKLVLVDTLGTFWRVRDENDAAEVTKAMKPFLSLARETGACVLLIHHARKSEGQYGDEIRGSGALFAAVDVALILKRHEVQTQRVLHAVSRYPDTPTKLVLDLTEQGYVALGDPAKLNKQARRDKIKAALGQKLEDRQTIGKRAGVSLRDTYRLLAVLVKAREAYREGKGRKGSPFRYRANSIHATPPVLGAPCMNRILSRPNSIRATPGPPARMRIWTCPRWRK